jgi:uncharacterized LabA/DUF88 family protein
MNKKVVVLIDGQNLFYGLRPLGLQERDIRWTELFISMLEPGDELIRTYWFRPQRLLDGHFTPDAIRNQIVYRNYNGCYQEYRSGNHSAIQDAILLRIEQQAKQVEQWLQEQRIRFSNIEYNYDQLCLDNSDIEIVKKGIVKVNPYSQEYNGEKGVDIALAVKMISLSVERKCDKIILVSGDYDYAEAINYVKNNMTKVHIVKLHKGYPPKNRSMSRDLSVLADKVIDLYEADIKNKYIKTHIDSMTNHLSPIA